jgi:hypothetical protein
MKIAVWSDGTWCQHHEIEATMNNQGLSDDFAVFSADSEDAAERIANNIQAGRSPLAR